MHNINIKFVLFHIVLLYYLWLVCKEELEWFLNETLNGVASGKHFPLNSQNILTRAPKKKKKLELVQQRYRFKKLSLSSDIIRRGMDHDYLKKPTAKKIIMEVCFKNKQADFISNERFVRYFCFKCFYQRSSSKLVGEFKCFTRSPFFWRLILWRFQCFDVDVNKKIYARKGRIPISPVSLFNYVINCTLLRQIILTILEFCGSVISFACITWKSK